ncbi:hypothetical protein LOTGIDRAFT_184912 [Lottia gigantea]|uniref:Importin N-terminal domain-containing protein n=1 Tax=Lottia gigantea TaxID=225164 RepID=V4BGG3_LOTGI|nr:hypothetical protein LOTGIDRAFT_184912 [Lottia gigantea]ESP04937.1 hypothetical protein LOTGIDRAFT_184912 [Lottia gigantea]
MADDEAQFQLLLTSLMGADNDSRTKSEEVYNEIPDIKKLELLLSTIRNANSSLEVRTMSCVLLRRLFSNEFSEVWPKLTPEIQNSIKQQLIVAINEETGPPVRKKICDVVAELARNLIGDDGTMGWPEILKFMFDCASSEDAGLRESALNIFSSVPTIFGNQQGHYLDVIKQMLAQSLQDRAHPQVCFMAVKSLTAFIIANDKDQTILNNYKDLVPTMMEGIVDSVTAQDDDDLLKCLIELAENTPKFLRPQMENIIPFCLKVLSDANLGDQWRQLSLEVIVTLSETAPAMVRKFAKFIPLLVPQILALMVDLEEEEDWAVQDDQEDDETDTNAAAAESSLDRLACALGGKTMLPHILANIPQMLTSSDWRYRHAALMAISVCGEGCHQHMEQMLQNITEGVLPFFRDPHPRVRYATCNAIGQMCTDFGPIFQKKFHDKIVGELIHIMDDDANPRVQAHGAAALVNFSEDCPKLILVQYLDAIVAKLEQVLSRKFKELLEKGNKLVLEQVVTTLASVADTAEEKFIKYYDQFMPCLKYIVQHAIQPELRLLRGKTIECISLIGLAVGKDKFGQDCNDVMQLLLKTQTESETLADDDPQISYMISAWARMCKILGSDFQQYLPLVMGPVLKAASLKPEVAVLDGEDMKAMENDNDWQFVTLGDQQSFGIRTAGLEEKATACQMLVCYARELKEAFAPYTDQVVQLMVPLLKFYFQDDVRIAASESLPYLIDCAKIRGEQYVVEMWNFILPSLLNAIEMEPEKEVVPEHLNSLAKSIEKLGKNCIMEENLNKLIEIIDKLFVDHFQRQEERQEKRKDEDYDEDLEETLLDEDDTDVYVLSKVSDIIHSFFGTHKEEFLPVFEKMMPNFVKLLNQERPWPDRQWALCIWDDVIEHTGPHSAKYQEYFLRSMIAYLCDKTPEVRQASAYGIGVQNRYKTEVYFVLESLPILVQVIEREESKSPENVNATENCISAVTKICKYNSSKVNLNDIIPRFVTWLPVYEDEDEAVHIFGYLCDLIDMNHPAVLGANNSNLPKIIWSIAEVMQKETFATDADIYVRLVNIVKQVQTNESVFGACLQELTPVLREALMEGLKH